MLRKTFSSSALPLRVLSLALIGLLAASTAIGAQDAGAPAPADEAGKMDAPAEAQADPATAALLDRADKLMYQLPTSVQKLSCKATLEGSSMMAPAPIAGELGVFWDGENAKFDFADARLRSMTSSLGLQASHLDGLLRQQGWRKEYAGCTLSSAEVDGAQVITVVRPEVPENETLTIGPDGVPIQISKPGAGTMLLTYHKIGEQFGMKSVSIDLEIPGLGASVVKVLCDYEEVEGHHVPKRLAQNVEMKEGGTSVVNFSLAFSSYKFNEAAEEPGQKSPTPTPTPTPVPPPEAPKPVTPPADGGW